MHMALLLHNISGISLRELREASLKDKMKFTIPYLEICHFQRNGSIIQFGVSHM